jgi:hypothetical protein
MTTRAASSTDSAVQAATEALAECDHSRLPAGLVAQIAVDSARTVWIAEEREELAALRREVRELRRR